MGAELTKERLREIKKLHESKERAEKGLFLIEGIRLIEEAIREKVIIEEALYTARLEESDRGSYLVDELRKMRVRTSKVQEKVLESAAGTENPQGVLAVAMQIKWAIEDAVRSKLPVIVACGLQDPGNLGTIIRTADAGMCGGVITTQNTVDIYNSKVIRATMGSIFRLPVVKMEDPREAILSLKKEGYQVIAATVNTKISYLDTDFGRPSAFLIGREASGLPDELLELADVKAYIPMKEGVESLNAAVSASILVYEAFRQKLTAS